MNNQYKVEPQPNCQLQRLKIVIKLAVDRQSTLDFRFQSHKVIARIPVAQGDRCNQPSTRLNVQLLVGCRQYSPRMNQQ